MIIKTKDFILRHVKLEDSQMLLEIELDKDNIKNMMTYTSEFKIMKKGIRNQLLEYKKLKPSSEMLIIETSDCVAGYISIHGLNKPNHSHKGEVSYALHPKFRGRGLMSRAVKLVVSYAFKKYKLKRLEGWCRTFNKSSARVLEKAGFKLEGVLRKNKCKDGKYLDDMVWAIVK